MRIQRTSACLLFFWFAMVLPASAGLEVLYNFSASTGTTPKGSMILEGSTLYGFTSSGGTGGYGVIFSIGTDGSNYDVLHHFSGPTNTNGNQPHHGYIALEGNTLIRPLLSGGADGQGTIYTIETDGSNGTLVYTFTGVSGVLPDMGDGAQSHSGLLHGAGSTYYGMTAAGGSQNEGVIYTYNSSTNVVTTLYSFEMSSGAESHGQLIWNSTGSLLLGMTRFGGTGTGNSNTSNNPPGGIFSFDPATREYTSLYDFTSTDDSPYFTDHGILTLGTGANATTIFGLTEFGGAYDEGAIFALSEEGGAPTVLHAFGNGTDGYHPFGSLTLGPDGFLYGMTRDGGSDGNGTIFRIAQDGTGYLLLDSFHNTSTGENPIDNVTISPDGLMLYGLTQAGGTNGDGTIFSFDLASIPEPGTAGLLIVAFGIGLGRRFIRNKILPSEKGSRLG